MNADKEVAKIAKIAEIGKVRPTAETRRTARKLFDRQRGPGKKAREHI